MRAVDRSLPASNRIHRLDVCRAYCRNVTPSPCILSSDRQLDGECRYKKRTGRRKRALHAWPAAASFGSPPTLVRATVHMQYLTSDVVGLGQVNNGIYDVADAGNCTHGRERLQEIFRLVLLDPWRLMFRGHSFVQF